MTPTPHTPTPPPLQVLYRERRDRGAGDQRHRVALLPPAVRGAQPGRYQGALPAAAGAKASAACPATPYFLYICFPARAHITLWSGLVRAGQRHRRVQPRAGSQRLLPGQRRQRAHPAGQMGGWQRPSQQVGGNARGPGLGARQRTHLHACGCPSCPEGAPERSHMQGRPLRLLEPKFLLGGPRISSARFSSPICVQLRRRQPRPGLQRLPLPEGAGQQPGAALHAGGAEGGAQGGRGHLRARTNRQRSTDA